MAKSSAAKKDLEFEDGKCTTCGNDFDDHDDACPPLPPAKSKQVKVDEAVAAKGGKPGGLKEQFDAATGETDTRAKLKLAEENFLLSPGKPTRAFIPVRYLRPMKRNPRAEVGDVSALEASMRSPIGFIGALWVREVEENVWEVFSGNRRLKAAKMAQLEDVPCDIYDVTEAQALEINLTEQINRADLTPLEEGEACRALMEAAGYSIEQVAAKLGQSASWVVKRTALCGIAPELKKELAKGHLSLTVANALAALPTQQQQVKAFDALEQRPDWEKHRDNTAEAQVEWLRAKQCRPLSDATWKLTDAELVPEAGACSTCPHNSATSKMPGLFDNAKAKPMCARTECFEDKALASWLARTAKQKAAGAKVLSLPEGKKLFAHGNALPTSSRYVEAGDKPPKDKQGRTWAELVADMEAEVRPVLHLAQDNAGKTRQLYVADKVHEAVAEVLKLKWAKSVVEEAEERKSPEAKAKKDAEQAERALAQKVRDDVFEAVISSVAADIARGNGTLPAMRLLAHRIGQRGIERLNAALGLKSRPKDWLEKGATQDELLALVWLDDASDELRSWDGFDERFEALAKAHGFKLDVMVKAQLETSKREAVKP